MANFPLLKAGGWVLGELLTPTQLNALNAMLPKIPNFLEGSSHTPSAIVEVLGSFGMKIATLRGRTTMTFDGSQEPRLTVVNNAGTKSVEIDAATGKVTVTDTFAFASAVGRNVSVPLQSPLLYQGAGAIPAPTKWSMGWTNTGTPFGTFWTHTDVSGTPDDQFLGFVVPPLRGGTLVSVGMYLDGNGGGANHSLLPATKPRIELIERAQPTMAGTVLATATDGTGTVPDYETPHWVTATLSAAYNTESDYIVRVRGENGSNAVPSALRIYAIRVAYNSSQLNA